MKTNRTTFTLLITFLFVQATTAAIWQTINPGFWNTGNVWSGGIVPPYSSADTFFIKNPVVLNSTLTLNGGAYMEIDSTGGGICGHEKVIVNTNAKIIKYGILEIDTLAVPGGQVECLMPGLAIFTEYGIISNGGSFYANCSLAVGPWFNCHLPEYGFISVQDIDASRELFIFPNPFSNHLVVINSNSEEATISLSDVLSRKVAVQTFNNSASIDTEQLSSGLYIYEVRNRNGIIKKGKVLKELKSK